MGSVYAKLEQQRKVLQNQLRSNIFHQNLQQRHLLYGYMLKLDFCQTSMVNEESFWSSLNRIQEIYSCSKSFPSYMGAMCQKYMKGLFRCRIAPTVDFSCWWLSLLRETSMKGTVINKIGIKCRSPRQKKCGVNTNTWRTPAIITCNLDVNPFKAPDSKVIRACRAWLNEQLFRNQFCFGRFDCCFI